MTCDTAASVAVSRNYGDQSAKVVQALLGHSSQQVTTEIYTHTFPEEFETLKDKLDAIYEEVFEGEKVKPTMLPIRSSNLTRDGQGEPEWSEGAFAGFFTAMIFGHAHRLTR
jgi:hypothetical protein